MGIGTTNTYYLQRFCLQISQRTLGVLMESTVILESFLLSKSGLENILSFEQFHREAPGNISETTLQLLYDKLVLQRDSNVLSGVRNRIEREFNVPIHPESHNEDLIRTEKYLLGDLVSRLEEIQIQLDANNSNLDESISTLIESIRNTISKFKGLRYKDQSASNGTSEGIRLLVLQAIQTIANCEDHIMSNAI